jgi:hypothetical protein
MGIGRGETRVEGEIWGGREWGRGVSEGQLSCLRTYPLMERRCMRQGEGRLGKDAGFPF